MKLTPIISLNSVQCNYGVTQFKYIQLITLFYKTSFKYCSVILKLT